MGHEFQRELSCQVKLNNLVDNFIKSITMLLMSNEQRDEEREQAEHEAYVQSVFDAYRLTSKLSTPLLSHAVLRGNRPDAKNAKRDIAIVEASVEVFEDEAWFEGGLQAQVQAADTKGLSLHYENLVLMSYSISGRTLITISDDAKNIDVTLVTSEDQPRIREGRHIMGIQGIDATASEAVDLIHGLVQMSRKGPLRMVPDADIRILGI